MSGVLAWTKANRWPLIVLSALIAASVWWSFAWDWASYQRHRPTQIIDVPRDTKATYGGAIFSLVELTVLPGESEEGTRYGVAPGTDVVVVDLNVTPRESDDPEDIVPCDVRLQAPSVDGQREWWPDVSNPSTYPEGDPDVFGCNVVGGGSYVLREFFTVPAGGADHGPVVEVTVLEEVPLALHLHW